ncbi:hypothetical protein HK102_004527, partial [Quaeritorhiza haematococci]
MPFFGIQMLLVGDPDELRKTLCRTDMYYRGLVNTALFLLPSGDQWKYHRKHIQPSFAPFHLRNTVLAAHTVADELLSAWDQAKKSRTPPEEEKEGSGGGSVVVDLFDYFACVALDVIGRVSFSHDFGAVKGLGGQPEGKGDGSASQTKNAKVAFDRVSELVAQRIGTEEWLWPLLGYSNKQINHHIAFIRNLAKTIIDERKKVRSSHLQDGLKDKESNGKTVTEEEDGAGAKMLQKDLMDRLLDVGADGKEVFTDDEIIDETIGFILAGN